MQHGWLPTLAWALAALGLLLLPASGNAESGKRRGPGSLVERHAERLDLDAVTLERIQDIVTRSGERDERLREEITAGRSVLRELLREPDPDPASVLAQADALGALDTEARKNRFEAILQIRSLLSPAQREELVVILDEERPGNRRRRGGLRRCGRDVASLCSDAPQGRELLRCLERQWDQLSDRCRSSFTPRDAR